MAEGQAGKKTRVDDYSYSYEYESDYDNARPPPVKPVDNRIACYSCDYEEIDGQPSTVGHCNEPFNGFGVPETMCNGSCFVSISIQDVIIEFFSCLCKFFIFRLCIATVLCSIL